MCEDCMLNLGDFCEITSRCDLDEIKNCEHKIPIFDMAFYYNEDVEAYSCIAFLSSQNNEIIRRHKVSQETIIKMLDREDKHLNSKGSILSKINKSIPEDSDFCEKTNGDDSFVAKNSQNKISDFKLAFYYDKNLETYRCIAYLSNRNNEIINCQDIHQEIVIQMLDREDGYLNSKNNTSILNKLN